VTVQDGDMGALRAAVRRCALAHGAYAPLGSVAVDFGAAVAAVDASAPQRDARPSSWVVRPVVLGATARSSNAQVGELLPRDDLDALSLFLGAPTTTRASGDSGRRIAAVFLPDGVRLFEEIALGAGVAASAWDYVPVGTPNRKGRTRGRFAEHVLRRVPPRGTPMGAEVAFLAVNLARVARGAVIADPCCGSGSLLIAAFLATDGEVDLRGSDADRAAAAAARENLQGVGAAGASRVEARPASTLLAEDTSGGPVGAVLCDPPYGRASRTLGPRVVDDVVALAAGRLQASGRLVLFHPTSDDPPRRVPGLRKVAAWTQTFQRHDLERELIVYERDERGDPGKSPLGSSSPRAEPPDRQTWTGGIASDRTRPSRALRRRRGPP